VGENARSASPALIVVPSHAVEAPNPEIRWCCVPGLIVTAFATGVPGAFEEEAPEDEDAEPEDDDAAPADAPLEDELLPLDPCDDALLDPDAPLDVEAPADASSSALDPRLDDAAPPYPESTPAPFESTGTSLPVLVLPHATTSDIAVQSGRRCRARIEGDPRSGSPRRGRYIMVRAVAAGHEIRHFEDRQRPVPIVTSST
jgi:hypothetical protein